MSKVILLESYLFELISSNSNNSSPGIKTTQIALVLGSKTRPMSVTRAELARIYLSRLETGGKPI